MRSIALDDIHQIGDEVATTLVLVLYLAPLVLDILVNSDEAVLLRDPPDGEDDDDSYCDSPLREFHCLLTVLGRLRGVYPDKTAEVSEYLLLDVLCTKTVPRYTNCRTYLRCSPLPKEPPHQNLRPRIGSELIGKRLLL